MTPEEQLAWPPPDDASVDDDRTLRGASGKNRSRRDEPRGPIPESRPGGRQQASGQERERDAPLTRAVARSDAEFAELGAAWSALLAECDSPSVFLSHEWMHAWWTAYRPAAELAIVVVRRGGRVRGIAPLCIRAERHGGLRVRVLRFIGDGTGETDHVRVLAAAADRDAVLAELFRGIGQLAWDLAELNQLPEGAAETRALGQWIRQQHWPFAVTTSPCPIRRLPASFDALLASLPGRLRTSIRSSRRKLAERHRVEFGMHDTPAQLPAALADLFRNHESRWQGKGIAGAFSDPRRRAFYERLTPRLLERGWLRFYYLRLDGRTVAQQYCFAVDGTVMLLQEGFDFAHAGDNVGNVLRSMVFEHLIATGAHCYDFLAGTSRHKGSWSDAVIHDLSLRCARATWRARFAFHVPLAIERAKDVLRPWRDRLAARLHRSRRDSTIATSEASS